MPDATVNGVRLAFDLHGPTDGEPVLLVCGLSQPAYTWELSILPGLVAAGYRVVTFDNRGMEPSDAPPAPYTVGEMADDAAGLIEHLDLAPCRVVGYSLGSWITEVLASDRPDLVRAAVCMAGLNASTEWEKVECEYGRDLAALDVPLPRYQGLMELLVYLPRAKVQDNDVVRVFAELFGADPPWGNPGRLGQWEAAVAWTRRVDEVARWERISVPCLAVAFEHDIDSPPARPSGRSPMSRVAVSSRSPTRRTWAPSNTPTPSSPPSPPSSPLPDLPPAGNLLGEVRGSGVGGQKSVMGRISAWSALYSGEFVRGRSCMSLAMFPATFIRPCMNAAFASSSPRCTFTESS